MTNTRKEMIQGYDQACIGIGLISIIQLLPERAIEIDCRRLPNDLEVKQLTDYFNWYKDIPAHQTYHLEESHHFKSGLDNDETFEKYRLLFTIVSRETIQ